MTIGVCWNVKTQTKQTNILLKIAVSSMVEKLKFNFLFDAWHRMKMLHKVNVWIDAGKLKEQLLTPEVLQVLKVVLPAWLPENICRKVSF